MTIRLAGSTSGYTEIDCPSVGGNNTLLLPTGNGSSGQVLSTNGSGALSWANGATTGPAFRAYRSTNQTVSNNAWNKLAATAENFDTNSNYDNATNYRFTPTVAGYYQVSGAISIEPSSSPRTRCLAAIYKNGSIYSRGSDVSASDNNASVITDVVYLNGSTDYVELFGYISAAASTYLFAGGPSGEYCYFSAFLARPA